jgi:serpin B
MTPIRRTLLLFAVLALAFVPACGSAPTPTAGNQSPTPAGGQPAGGAIAISNKPHDMNPDASQQDLAELSQANAAFAFDLYQAISRQSGNLFLSPYSVSTALAMTFAGASGETANQMASTLHFTLPQERLHAAFNAYALALKARADQTAEGTPFELNIANALWGQQGFGFQAAFLDLLAENYGAGLRLVDYASDPEAARKQINQWVSVETKGKIQDLIPSGAIDAMTRLVLSNAIYFKAAWMHPFDPQATTNDPFHKLDGSVSRIPMMHQTQHAGYLVEQGYTALELPYQDGGFSMLILVPDVGQFEAIEAKLNSDMIQHIVDGMSYGEVNLSLPKFSYDASFELNRPLAQMGMPDAFDPQRADFSAMDGRQDLYIGAVLHKAFVSVDEQGTEAAAATAVIMELMSAPAGEPVTITVDRPFIFLIRDQQSGSILFMGRVVDPAS